MLTGGIYIYTECLKRKYCTVESDTQYFDLQAGFNNFKIIHFGGELRTCPDGGQVDWSNGAGATIGQCFVTSFNDDIGSGTYQNRCHYDMGVEI